MAGVDTQLGYLAPFLWRSAVFGPGLTSKFLIVDNAYRIMMRLEA